MRTRPPWLCSLCSPRRPSWLSTSTIYRHNSHPFSRAQSTSPETTLSPTLLTRARALAAEHTTLSASLAESFSTRLARRLGPLQRTSSALTQYDTALTSLTELQSLLSDPSTDPELRTLAAEDLPSSESALALASAELKSSLVPPHPFAHLPCLLEIRPGAGGSEAALFASDLVRMYTAYFSRTGLRYNMLKYDDALGPADPRGSDAPLMEAILEVETDGAYGKLRCEAGVHRVQRVPATESKGRTHTSSASVLVLPSFAEENEGVGEEEEGGDGWVDPKDVKTDFMRARGAGGQHVNTTNSAVRLTHLPTGTVVAIQDQRSQHKNRDKAWRLLRSKVAQQRREEKEAEMLRMRRGVVAAGKLGRENKVRTYNWGQQRVTDHRSGFSVHDLDDTIEGGESLEKVMDSVRRWMEDGDVLALAAEGEEVKDK
ncbi:release factor [Myriangium duriaei CBS 260.36]|uniref:Release factor n=1 Tax=Myriangium duriaei CBS 260.36 TaxID=1168546 RepID=A0A9P4MPZ0_9PEZI|nr:release factor [Myriangium duriaei CBS 260.36]